MKRILIFVLLGPLIAATAVIAQTAFALWRHNVGSPSGPASVSSLIYGTVILFYVFGFVPAFLTSLVDIVLAKTSLGRWLRVGLTALGGLVISGSLPSLLAQMRTHDIPSFSWSSFFGLGLLGALCAAICSYLCSRNEKRRIAADDTKAVVPV